MPEKYPKEHNKKRDCEELCKILAFADENNIDIDLEPPKRYRRYGKLKNGFKRLIEKEDLKTMDVEAYTLKGKKIILKNIPYEVYKGERRVDLDDVVEEQRKIEPEAFTEIEKITKKSYLNRLREAQEGVDMQPIVDKIKKRCNTK